MGWRKQPNPTGSTASFYKWRAKYGGMDASIARHNQGEIRIILIAALY